MIDIRKLAGEMNVCLLSDKDKHHLFGYRCDILFQPEIDVSIFKFNRILKNCWVYVTKCNYNKHLFFSEMFLADFFFVFKTWNIFYYIMFFLKIEIVSSYKNITYTIQKSVPQAFCFYS